MNIPIGQIRDDFDFYYAGLNKPLNTVKELVEDITKNGLKEPLIVRKIGNNFYEVIEGVHRLRALKELRWKEVPCEIVEYEAHNHPCPVERNR
jgi:hypothetical protein